MENILNEIIEAYEKIGNSVSQWEEVDHLCSIIEKAKAHKEQLASRYVGMSSEIDLTPSLIDRTTQIIHFNYDFDADGYFECAITKVVFQYDGNRQIEVNASEIDKETLDYLEMLVHGNADMPVLRDLFNNKD